MSEPQPQPQPQQPQLEVSQTGSIIMLVIIGLWIIASVWAIIKSLLCTGKSGSTAEKILGIVIAFFMGPFYFLYLYANKNYCLDEPSPLPEMAAAAVGGKRKHK